MTECQLAVSAMQKKKDNDHRTVELNEQMRVGCVDAISLKRKFHL